MNQMDKYFFGSKEGVDSFLSEIDGYTTRVYYADGSFQVMLIKKKGIFNALGNIPDLTRDEAMFDRYTKAIRNLSDNLSISTSEDNEIKSIIRKIKKCRDEAEER